MSIKIIQVDLNELVQNLNSDAESEVRNPLCDLHSGRAVALDLLLVDASELARFSTDIDHSPGLSWHVDFTLYVTRVPTLPEAFALLKLAWDDNWGCWAWSFEVAIVGALSLDEAKIDLLGIYKASQIEFAFGSYREFLDNLA